MGGTNLGLRLDMHSLNVKLKGLMVGEWHES
jgi:hypothetical protein